MAIPEEVGVKGKVYFDGKEVQDILKGMIRRGEDLTPAMKIIGHIYRDSVRENFRVGGRPQKWKPLADSTLLKVMGCPKASECRKKRGKGTKISAIRKLADKKTLIDTKRLMNSITYKPGRNTVEIGTDVEYAATHQFGRGKIPKRPFLVGQDEDLEQAKETLSDYVIGEE